MWKKKEEENKTSEGGCLVMSRRGREEDYCGKN